MNALKTLVVTLTLALISTLTFANDSLSAIYKQLGLSEDITYTADMDVQMAGMAKMPAMGPTKVYFKKGAMRTEMEMSGMKMVTLMQKDGTMFSYNDMTKSWMKTHINQAMQGAPVPVYTKIGDEKVDGLDCIKYEMKDPNTGVSGSIWVNDQMIYKNAIVMPQGTTTVCFKNIKKQDLEDSLFSPPADAQIQDMGDMMKALQAKAPEIAAQGPAGQQ